MDDMKWLYYLIVVLYGVLASIRGLNHLIVKDLISNKEDQTVIVKVFKKDFFTTIAGLTLFMAILINVLCFIGNRPFNLQSLLVSIAVLGMALLSGLTKIHIVNGEQLIIAGYLLKQGDIKSYKMKNSSSYPLYTLCFNEDLNGYESIKFYTINKDTQKIQEVIRKNMKQEEKEK